jgi:hypothetical protein
VEPDRFDNVVRVLFSAPSRRAFNHAVIGSVAGALLAPFLGVGHAAAAKKGKKAHKGKERRRNKRKKVKTVCPTNTKTTQYAFCPNPNESAAGNLSGCCTVTPNPASGNPLEVCTDCGCCPYNSECCRGALEGVCCPSGAKCSISPDFKSVGCCSPPDKVCYGGCCNEGEDCCLTPAPGNIPYCCAVGLKCKIQGPNDITCQSA